MIKKFTCGFLVVLCLSVIWVVPSNASSMIVLGFEDLDDTGTLYHTMSEHNPYGDKEINFYGASGPYGEYTLNHYNNPDYANPHSGQVYLFNPWGYDGISIGFSEPVLFEGAWVGYPKASYLPEQNRAKEFWFEGYLGEVKVGESAKITLDPDMQWSEANLSGPVDKVVFRRSTQSGETSPINGFYTIDDITFSEVTAPILIANLKSDITGLNIPQSTENNLTAKISVADKVIGDKTDNNDNVALNTIEAFIKYVESQRGKKISTEEADALIDKANKIIDLLLAE